MTLTADSIIHQNSGGSSAVVAGGTVTVSLTGGETTEAGNTLIVFLAGGAGAAFGSTPPSGWANIDGTATVDDASIRIFLRGPSQGLAAGESSWNFTAGAALPTGPVRWLVWEIEGVVSSATLADILNANSGSPTQFTSGTTAFDTTGVTSTYDGLAISVHLSYNPSGTDTWGSHTDGFTEVDEGSQSNGGTGNITLSVSALHVNEVGAYGATATCSRTLTTTNAGLAYTMVITAADAKHAANLRLIDGAEHGLITGNTVSGLTNNKIAESATAGVSVSGTAARSGNYGWLYSSSSAACNSIHGTFTAMAGSMLAGRSVWRLHFRFPTLPGADADIWVLRDLSANALITVRFVDASDKIGITAGAGTQVLSDTTITANQWVGVDIVTDFSTTAHKIDWRVDYNAELTDTTAGVVQTQATVTGSANPTVASIRRGWTTSITATMHFDDFANSAETQHYPIGDLRVLPRKVDPAGTVVLSGTSTNFGVMTANGATISAWNATNARNAVDDIPPDLSGTRDAAGALLAHATDYIEFPVEPFDMAANKVNVRGQRAIVCLWAASATTATMRLAASINGTLISGAGTSEADPSADNTSTPVWVQFMIRPSTGRVVWNQTDSDGLRLRFGSNDATPDIMVDAFVVEMAVVKARAEDLFGEAGQLTHVEAHRDPDTQALVGATVTNDSGDPIELSWEVDGVPDSSGLIPDGTTDQYVPMSPDGGIQTVGRVDLNPG